MVEYLLEVTRPWAGSSEPKTNIRPYNTNELMEMTQDRKPGDTKWLQKRKVPGSEILGSGGMVAQPEVPALRGG